MRRRSVFNRDSLPVLADDLPTAWDHAPRLGTKWRSSRRRLHVVGQELFAEVLRRERKRAERSEQDCVLLLVDTHGVPSRRVVAAVRDAVLGCGVEGALFGWHSATTLGVILPDATGGDWSSLLRRALGRRLDRGAAARISIRTERILPQAATLPVAEQPPRPGPHDQAPVAPHHGYPLKRSLDLFGSIALLLVLAPVFLLVAALVKVTSRGPVLFRQTRVGQGGRTFTMLKFRTMRVDSDESLHYAFATRFIRSTIDLTREDRPIFKLTKDPRVTPIGRILRETSLDELPQFWNVLRGEMSLVGPRPPLPYEVEHYRPWHWHRVLHAKPGVTGLWQVVGRSRTTFDEMVRLDLRYVRTCSLKTDVQLLLATPRAVVSRNGAA